MDQDQERIEADLRGLLDGEVRCDDVFVQMYASDASIYEIRPLGVVRPRNTDDVVACVQYAEENGIPIHARGAGTGLAGESLGTGLVLDFSHTMRRIVSTSDETVRVQPGVTLAQLNRHLAQYGRMFGPDPAMSSVTTMGSVLAIDGSGSHWLQHGSARDHVTSMEIVDATGEVLEFGRESTIQRFSRGKTPRFRDLVGEINSLVIREQAEIEAHRPKSLVNRCGYHLDGIVTDAFLDMHKLLVGSEGTLALTVEATIRSVPIPGHRAVALLLFDRLERAARAALEVPAMGVTACDLMDRRLLSLAREWDVRYDLLIPQGTEAMLLVEAQGDDSKEVRERLQKVIDRIVRRKRFAFDARTASDAEETELYWRLARRVVPSLYRLEGSNRPLPFVEDMAIPPEVLPDFLVRLQNVLKKHQVTASLFAHAGHGQLHVRPFLNVGDPEHVRKMESVAAEFYQEVFDVGGTISGEHADGLSRTMFIEGQYGSLYSVFREVKRLFDPHNIFNPGKVISDDSHVLTKNLRRVAPGLENPHNTSIVATDPESNNGPPQPEVLDLQLNWDTAEIIQAARACNGCGACRTQGSDTRMCPIFRFSPREEASPRAKANIMRAVLTGRLDPSLVETDALKSLADLCVNCHQCRSECPASVDIPKLMTEAKAQYVATNGMRLSDALLIRLDKVAAVGSMMSRVSNWALGDRQMRWLIERVFGIAQGRKVPRFAAHSFLRRAARRRLTRPTRRSGLKILYFIDVYAKWFDLQLADALVAVMEHNGVAVYVHPEQLPAGMISISMGATERAKRLAEHNVEMLAEAIRQGYHIVTTEPSAALCLTHEYLNLRDDDDTRLVAENTSEACAYLWTLHQTGRLKLDFDPLNARLGYHLPCHQRALDTGSPGENLLRLIPGLTVQRIDRGCSGMAGLFGMKRDNFRTSLRAGWELISALREPAFQFGTTECSSCKIQMEQGTTKPTIHPLKLLALAYGRMPEVSELMTRRGEELFVT